MEVVNVVDDVVPPFRRRRIDFWIFATSRFGVAEFEAESARTKWTKIVDILSSTSTKLKRNFSRETNYT